MVDLEHESSQDELSAEKPDRKKMKIGAAVHSEPEESEVEEGDVIVISELYCNRLDCLTLQAEAVSMI